MTPASTTAPRETIVVAVTDLGELGPEVFDAEHHMMPVADACKIDRNLAKTLTVRRPNIDPAKVDSKVYDAVMKRYKQELAGIPKVVPVQRYHHRTFREQGFYVVEGAGVRTNLVIVRNPKDGKWIDRPGTTWSECFGTLGEAKEYEAELLAKPEPPAPKTFGKKPASTQLAPDAKQEVSP